MSNPTIQYWLGQNAATLANGVIIRPLTLPSSWNKIRIGAVLGFTTGSLTNVQQQANLFLGLCSGNNGYGTSISPTNFIGLITTTNAWSYYTASVGSWYRGVPYNIYGIAGSGNTSSFSSTFQASNSSTFYINFPTTIDGRWGVQLYLDIEKGSTEYTLQPHYYNSTPQTAHGYLTDTMFLRELTSNVPVFASGESSTLTGTARSIPFSEDSGSLDSINIFWNRESPNPELIISAVAIAILS